MKIYSWIIKQRFFIGCFVLLIGVIAHIFIGINIAWIPYLVGLLLIAAHFLFGTLRAAQEALEASDIAQAEKALKTIWFPRLLIKPIRSIYYTLQGNIAMSKKDFDAAESLMKKGIATGMPMKEAEGASLLQISMLSAQKGDWKKAESYIRSSLQKGLPDKESKAAAYLQMCSVMMNKRQFRSAKDFYKRAKDLKPKSQELVQQIQDIGKYIGRIPG